MKKHTIQIMATVICSAIVLFIFNFYNNYFTKNHFKRKIKHTNIEFISSLELPDKSFGFAGRFDSVIFLNRATDQINIYKVPHTLKRLHKVTIKYGAHFKTGAKNIYKDTFASYIYCTNPYGDISISDGQVALSYTINNFRFDFFNALTKESLIVRARYPRKEQTNRSIAKLTLTDRVNVSKEYHLPNVINGTFVNDGILLYDKENLKIFYMYFYKGEFLSLDTNLNLQYSSKTIDTVKHGQVKTILIPIQGNNGKEFTKMLTQSKPPKVVNAYFTTDKYAVYVASRLQADNEKKSDFSQNQIIDVYKLQNGKYDYSFYIPKYKGKKLNQFQIKENIIVAIYGTSLVKYHLSKEKIIEAGSSASMIK